MKKIGQNVIRVQYTVWDTVCANRVANRVMLLFAMFCEIVHYTVRHTAWENRVSDRVMSLFCAEHSATYTGSYTVWENRVSNRVMP